MGDRQPTHKHRLIGALLRVPYQRVVAQVYAKLITAGFCDLRPAHLTVFQLIDERAGSRLTNLAADALMTKQSMGYLVDYLEEHGYVTRVADPADGRARLVRLTERGMAVMAAAREIVEGIQADWGRIVGKRRMDQLLDSLHTLVMYLEDTPVDVAISIDGDV